MAARYAGRNTSESSASADAAIRSALSLQQQGRVYQADALCAQVLQSDPRHFAAWHLRGLIALQSGQIDRGVELIERSLKINPNQALAHSNIGNALLSGRQPELALARFERALQLNSTCVAALYNRGNALRDLHRFGEALDSYDQALQLKGDYVQALNNRGLVLLELGRLEEALIAFERASELDPRFAAAMGNSAAALLKLERPLEALAQYERLLESDQSDTEAWCGRGKAQLALKQPEQAHSSFARALQIDPAHVAALINRGHALQCLQRPADALSDYETALRLAPDSALALNNSGNALMELGRAETALARYDRALQLSPGNCDTLYNRGAALRELKRYQESAHTFAELMRIAPEHDYVLGNLFHLRMDYCSWEDYAAMAQQVHGALEKSKRVINPLSLLLSDSPALQLQCAQVFAQDKYAQREELGPCVRSGDGGAQGRIRVAYVSADLCEHPVSQLLVGALERHDRERFEVIGVSLQSGQGGAFEQRVRAAFDRFIDVTQCSDREAAQWLRELQVDIAVDLMGFTQGLRLGIFAQRAAPVQVSYLGYAGTLGARYMDYLLADEVVIPAGQERWYSEQVVRLPHCYLPNDEAREVAAVPTRAQAGLPERGLVFCAFTNAYKINPPVFEIWMRLLRESAGSVLWLRGMGREARENLGREAQARGVEAKRLVFAAHVPSMAEHLGRQGLADLYLDTLPYNAHSTACDALWAGVPVLTCAGSSFASRVAASALSAVGLPELITHSLEHYQERGLELARDPQQLAGLRSRLGRQRSSAPLFDTGGYTRHLESAYRTMHERSLRGEAPAAFNVSTL